MTLLPSQQPTYARHHASAPRSLPGDTCPGWVTRGANFVVVVSQAQAGDVLVRDNLDEYVLLVPETPGLSVNVQSGGETLQAEADSLTIVPPGNSRVEVVTGAGLLVRIFSSDVTDVLALADNHAKIGRAHV